MTTLERQAGGLGFVLSPVMRSHLASYEDLRASWERVEKSGCGPGPGRMQEWGPGERAMMGSGPGGGSGDIE